MPWAFNPFTGTFDITGAGETVVIDDANAVVMLETCIVDGELIVEEESLVTIKNSLSSAYQKIVEQVTVKEDGQMVVEALSSLEVLNG